MKKLFIIGVLILIGISSSILYSKSNKETIPNLKELMNLRIEECPHPNGITKNVASVEDTQFGYQHCTSCRIGVYSQRDDKRFVCSYCGESPKQSN